jgi:thiol:disulfide interchange protein
MPCVLPVIFMKLRTFAMIEKKTAIWGSIVGNYISFMSFAAFLHLLKLGGKTIGWGMHFQNITFLKTMAVGLFLFFLYSIDMIAIFPSIEIKEKKYNVFIFNVISNIVAAMIAIPCTAPFLGTAAAFALQESAIKMCAIFFAIGTGFSLPYVIALFVRVHIPKRLLKFSEIFGKIANAGVGIAWLWILFLVSNHLLPKVLLIYLLLFGLAGFLFHRGRNVWALLSLLVSFGISNENVVPSHELHIENQKTSKKNENLIWQRCQHTNLITKYLEADRIVIFNISADWCLTCKYNKNHVLNDDVIIKLIRDKNVVCLEGDMTKKNDNLMKFIVDHNRIGIPFTIIYGPGARDGIILSELPSINEVIDAFKKAEISESAKNKQP